MFEFFDPLTGEPNSRYTANAGAYVVNNRFIDPDAPDPRPNPSAVPMPATLLLLGAALQRLRVQRRFRP